jgi:VTC domain-containing protein
VTGSLRDLVASFEPISLGELDEHAALQRRVDNKYLITARQFGRLAEELRGGHRVLEIDDERTSAYESVYFDTESLRCYSDHVADRRPRFKTRSRLYQATGTCVFEVKLKGDDGETDKRHLDQPVEAHGRLTPDARRFLHETLADAGLDVGEVGPALITSFTRVTFAAQTVAARATCDFGVHFSLHDGPSTQVRDDFCLVETKSEEGDSPADRLLAEIGVEARSFSKYQVGTQILTEGADEVDPEVAGALS